MCHHKRGAFARARGSSAQCSNDCAGARAGLPSRAAYDLSELEDITLDVARLLLSAQVSGLAHFWETAMEHAETHLSSLPGATLNVHVMALMRTLRRDRTTPFTFLSFGCTHISGDEVALISLLQAMQLGSQLDVDDALEHLAQGGPVDGLRAAAVLLAERMRAIEPALRQSTPQPGAIAAGLEQALH